MTSKREHITRLKQKIKDMQHQLSQIQNNPSTASLAKQAKQSQRKPIFSPIQPPSPSIRRSGSCFKQSEVKKWNRKKRQFSHHFHSKSPDRTLSPQKQHIADLLYQRFYQPKQNRRSPSPSPKAAKIIERVDRSYYSRQSSKQKEESRVLREYNSSALLNRVQSSVVTKARPNPIVNPESSPYRKAKRTLQIETSPVRLLQCPPSNQNIQVVGERAFVMQHKGATSGEKNYSKIFSGQIESPRPSGKKHFGRYFMDTHSWRAQAL